MIQKLNIDLSNVTIKELGSLDILSLKDDDIIIFTIDTNRWDFQEIEFIAEEIRHIFPDNKILFLLDGMTFGIIDKK